MAFVVLRRRIELWRACRWTSCTASRCGRSFAKLVGPWNPENP